MSKPLLCVTVTAPSMAELRRRRDEVADADLVELRLDYVRDPDVAGALAGRRRPVIVTCRPTWEGGHFQGAEEERRRILADALALGAEYVDVEARAHFDDLVAGAGGRRIVLSHHDFEGMPADLPGLMRAMRSTGAEIVKIAVTTRRLSDCVPLLTLGASAENQPGLIVIGMGEHGLATRVLAGRFGSMWTYAGAGQDIGQITTAALVDDYRFRTLSATTAVYGLVGQPISHSVSPAMHNAAFRAAGIDAVYLPFPAVSADDAVTFGRALGVQGLSVTIPYKVSLADAVDDMSAVARRIGAVNTIHVVDGRWVGGNTDVEGFLAPLAARASLPGLRVSVLGGGGAARAAAVGLAARGCAVRIHARHRDQAEAVARLASAEVGPYPPEKGSWDLLVNCTPVGMYPREDATPMAAGDLTGDYVYDLIYNPIETRLLADAARAGCRTIGGLDMLVGQAQEQFYCWTGVRPDAAVMRQAAAARLAGFMRDENHVV